MTVKTTNDKSRRVVLKVRTPPPLPTKKMFLNAKQTFTYKRGSNGHLRFGKTRIPIDNRSQFWPWAVRPRSDNFIFHSEAVKLDKM